MMISILAQGLGQDAALVGGGVALTVATLLIKRGFQLRVGTDNDKDQEKGTYNAQLCRRMHAEIDRRQNVADAAIGKLSEKVSTNFASVHQKIDRIAEHLMGPHEPKR